MQAQGQPGHLAVTLFRNKNNQGVVLLSRAAVFRRPNAEAEEASSLTLSGSLCLPLTLYDF